MIIVPTIIAFLVATITYFISGFLFSDMTKMSKAILSLCVFLTLAGFFTYKIYKGVHTLPEGAYYIDQDELTDDGVLKDLDATDSENNGEP